MVIIHKLISMSSVQHIQLAGPTTLISNVASLCAVSMATRIRKQKHITLGLSIKRLCT